MTNRLTWQSKEVSASSTTATIPDSANEINLVVMDIYRYVRGSLYIPALLVMNNETLVIPLEGGKRVVLNCTNDSIVFSSSDYTNFGEVMIYYR